MLRTALLVLALASLASAPPASAQPAGSAVTEAWLRHWRTEAAGVRQVRVVERSQRSASGPRGDLDVTTVSEWVLPADGEPSQQVRSATVNGRSVPARRLPEIEQRLHRAYGPAGREAGRPAALPARVLRSAEAGSLTETALDGQPVWQVDLRLRGPFRRGRAWFTRSAADPQLVRLRLQGTGGPPGRRDGAPPPQAPEAVRLDQTLDYVRVDGLDLARSVSTSVTVRQRRRLRVFTVSVEAEAVYEGHAVERR